MIKNINIVSIIVGILATQSISALLAIIFVISYVFIYGTNFMVAALEYPLSIVLTMLMSLAAVFFGGFITMFISKKSLINPFIVGLLYLAGNIGFFYFIDFVYARNYQWILLVTAILTLPVTVLGGYVYKIKSHKNV